MANSVRGREAINGVTERVIGCAFKVSNMLGSGFVEKVYENALVYELQKAGLDVGKQHHIQVYYDGVVVGHFIADLLVEEKVLVELKAVKELQTLHTAQALNYLKASGLNACLLLNFGRPKLEIKRIVHNF